MRTFLYSQTCPKGKLFEDEGEIKEALASGWVDAPYAIGDVADDPVSDDSVQEVGELKARIKELEDALSENQEMLDEAIHEFDTKTDELGKANDALKAKDEEIVKLKETLSDVEKKAEKVLEAEAEAVKNLKTAKKK